jgi:hypothetical protein
MLLKSCAGLINRAHRSAHKRFTFRGRGSMRRMTERRAHGERRRCCATRARNVPSAGTSPPAPAIPSTTAGRSTPGRCTTPGEQRSAPVAGGALRHPRGLRRRRQKGGRQRFLQGLSTDRRRGGKRRHAAQVLGHGASRATAASAIRLRLEIRRNASTKGVRRNAGPLFLSARRNCAPGCVVSRAGEVVAAGEIEEVLAAIRASAAYVNVHTAAVPSGEVRAQLRGRGHGGHHD